MDIGAIFLLLSVCLLVGLFVARPFMERLRIVSSENDPVQSALLAERDRLLGALQELDFDYTMGKIPAQDYPVMRKDLVQHASNVLRSLDALRPEITIHEDAESRVEAVIAAQRADAAVQEIKPKDVTDDDLEDLVAARRSVRKEKSAGFCPKCGKPVLRSDRFCPACGKSIS